jgi:hypothetical protein
VNSAEEAPTLDGEKLKDPTDVANALK